MHSLLNKRVVLITGKGGVGRSTVTAATALLAARTGKRVLVTEIGENPGGHSPVARLFGRDNLPSKPVKLAPLIHGGHLNAKLGQESFLSSVLRIPAMAKLAMRTRPLLAFLNFAPSFHEMGIFYHLLFHMKARTRKDTLRYDLILIDMPATGHTLALTGLPGQLLSIIPSGPVAVGLREGQSIINDPDSGAAYVVTLPEILPVTECLELVSGLRETAMPVGGVILNMVPQNRFSPEEREALAEMVDGKKVFGQHYLDRVENAERATELLKAELDVDLVTIPFCGHGGGRVPDMIADYLLEEGA